jgi:hypothetical protein
MVFTGDGETVMPECFYRASSALIGAYRLRVSGFLLTTAGMTPRDGRY